MSTHSRLLELALKGLEAERQRIDEEIADIRQQIGNGAGRQPAARTQAAAAPRKNRLSAAGRKAISNALKRRWAEKRKAEARAAK
jgi:hypothetical protein